MSFAAVAPAAGAASYYFGGYEGTGSHLGVDGYVRQSPTGPLTSGQHHVAYINVCQGSCFHWVQTGTYQGYLQNSSSPNDVHMFHENTDQCDRYTQGDNGAPPQADYPYYLTYNGTGAHNQTCPDGTPSTFYVFEFRKGSFANVPFYYGQLGALSGPISAETELYPSQSVPEANDYFGCSPTLTCTNTSYGLHLYDGSFQLWTSGANTLAGNPPHLNQKQHYWAFETCASGC